VLGVGLLVIAALSLTLAVRVPLFAGLGDKSPHPTTLAQLDDKYELGMGDLAIDLRDLTFPRGETSVKATVGIGDLTIRVPADVTVDVDGHASGGQVVLFGNIDDGTSVHSHAHEVGTAPLRVLDLDARVGFGRVTVERG
jgi:predicted membrane protein